MSEFMEWGPTAYIID